jgi:myo-inositol-1(or 4)-monophosphatase
MTATRFRPETRAAIQAVRHGLLLAHEQSGQAAVTPKAGRDVVTSADIAVEEAIAELIADRTGLPVVGEEGGGEIPPDGSACWLVDPICGTRNYAGGTTLYSINVALAEDGQITAGVVGDPSAGEVLVAELGRGAAAAGSRAPDDWRPLRTTDAGQTVAIEPARSAGPRREHAAAVIADVIRADQWDFRSLASTLSLAYVARGTLSAWAVFVTDSPVHCAAGTLLVGEAGGIVSDIDGVTWSTESDSCLASATPSLHAQLVDLIAKWRD